MQAIKEKLNDMSAMSKAKAEAKQEEKEEKELAKSRLEVAHEVRLAREAEAAMDLHVNKAATKVVEHETKYPKQGGGGGQEYSYMDHPYNYGGNPYNSPAAGCSTDTTYGSSTIESAGGQNNPYAYDCETGSTATTGTGYPAGNRSRGPPPSNNLL